VIQTAAKEYAAERGISTSDREHVEAIKPLYGHEASPTRGGKYSTAFQMAANSGNLLALKWLLAHGADPRVKGGRHGTALEAAVKNQKYAVFSYLGSIMEDEIENCVFILATSSGREFYHSPSPRKS